MISLILLLITSVHAESCTTQEEKAQVLEQQLITTDVPNHLKGAIITIKQADGKESTVPAEKFKVVPRKQQYLVTKIQQTITNSCQSGIKPNRISILGGYGPSNTLKHSSDGNLTEVESRYKAVGGAQYQRNITDELSVGVQGQTNKSGALLLGVDF